MAAVAKGNGEEPTCEQCYFRKKMLCALDLEKPCVSFRADRPEGLSPPRQPVLLMRPPRWASDPDRADAAARNRPAVLPPGGGPRPFGRKVWA